MLEQVNVFLSAGGPVLWLIFFVLSTLWFFIFERLYYFYKTYPLEKQQAEKNWLNREDKTSWFALKIREEQISKMKQKMIRFIFLIKTLVLISPLLGLMGTVTGMISIFDIISISGTGNPRLLAGGISLAVIPTMAGLVTALSGLYFANYFEKKYKKLTQLFLESLSF